MNWKWNFRFQHGKQAETEDFYVETQFEIKPSGGERIHYIVRDYSESRGELWCLQFL